MKGTKKKQKDQEHSITTEMYRAMVIKASDDADIAESRTLELDRKREIQFQQQDIIEPPNPPSSLCHLFRISNALRQNVEAYETNIDSFGHRFVPTLDLDGPKAINVVKELILLQTDEEISDEEAEEKIKDFKLEATKELAKIRNFFKYCICDGSFISLRRKLRRDNETVGWGAFEVLRDKKGEIAQFVHVSACWIRLMPLGESRVINMRIRKDPITFDTIRVHRRFRVFVQMDEIGDFIFFKEFGDDRLMSKDSGKFYESENEMKKVEGEEAKSATELMYLTLSNFSLDSPYGEPRWIGNLLSVLGSRESEEVNFLYFQNKSVPPLAILVMGGRLQTGAVKRLEDFVENHLRGKRNFHKILILEAMPFGKDDAEGVQHSGRARIELKPLTDAQTNDALFQNYDEKNRDKVGESFRLPRLLRGDIRDFNRGTADASLAFAESQIFSPERGLFDAEINRKILTDMGIRFWEFMSLGPITKDSQTISEMIERLVKVGVITPEEGRIIAEDVFNMAFDKLDVPWVKQPLSLTLAGLGLQLAENQEMSELPSQRDRKLKPFQEDIEDQKKQDLTTASLVDGGLLVPGQGCPPGKFSFGVCPEDDEKEPKFFQIPISKIEESNGEIKLYIPSDAFQELIDVE